MKKILIILAVLLIGLIGFVLKTLSGAGFFRTIQNSEGYTLVRQYEIPGAEDFAISREDGFLLISSDDRAARITGGPRKGGIYFLDLEEPAAQPSLISDKFSKAFFPHGISLIKIDSTRYKLFVINHVEGKHSVEVFQLEGENLRHEKTIRDPMLISPNDLVAIDEKRFYYTNDHLSESGFRKVMSDYLGWPDANVGYYDGNSCSIVAEDFRYANGINYDAGRKLLYVAALRSFQLKVFRVEDSGQLKWLDKVDCKTGVDNIELDDQGRLWIGSHPNLLSATAYLTGKQDLGPSEVIVVDYKGEGKSTVKTVYLNDGTEMSASSVALPYGDRIFIGNVMDDHFIEIKLN